MKRAETITVPENLRERLLSVVDSECMRDYLREGDAAIYFWVALVGSSPRPMDDKLSLLKELKDVGMDSESLGYLNRSIHFAEEAMKMLYHSDPEKSVILLNEFDSAPPDPFLMGTGTPCRSYQEALEEIRFDFPDEDSKIPLSEESDYQDYYFSLELYQVIGGRYEEQYTYYCAPNGKVQYFRIGRTPDRYYYKDRERADLEEIFSGREGLKYQESPYQPGDILYVDMRPWYRPTYCMVCWICPSMPYDTSGIQVLYPTHEGLIGEESLKYGRFLPQVLKDSFDPDRVFFCPLYRAVPYEGELPEEYSFMKPLSEKLKADPSLPQKMDDFFMDGKNLDELTMVYRPACVERSPRKDITPDTYPVWIPGQSKEREWWEESRSEEGVRREWLAAFMGENENGE